MIKRVVKTRKIVRTMLVLLAVACLAACGSDSAVRQIVRDSDNPKKADTVLRRADSVLAHGRLSEEETGLLLLSKAKAQFAMTFFTQSFPPRLDSVINAAVHKLEKHNSSKLAESYYWQGMISNLCYGRPVEGIVALEKAHLILPDDDSDFQARLYQQLSTVYELLGNLDMAIRYTRQAVAIFDSKVDPVGQLVIHYDIHTLFRQNGQKDSADYYLRLAIHERKRFNDKRFDVFNESFGNYYLEHHDLRRAKYYLSHAITADGRMPEAQLGLARIAHMEHRPAEEQWHLKRSVALADSLYSAGKAYRITMVYYLGSLARFYADTGAREDELRTRRQLYAVRDAVERRNTRLMNEAAMQERSYLVQKLDQEYRQQNRSRLTFIAIIVVLSAAYVLSWVRRYIKVSREKLGKVRQKTYKQAHEIGKLKDQVKEYSKTQADRIITGRPLYEAIEKGTATMKGWDKEALECYICYARFIDPDVFATLNDKLTAKPTIFFYLWKKGYNDMEIARIMNVSNGSIRTMRYNIRKQDV